MNNRIKIVVIGGSGLIGKKLVYNLRQQGHEVVAASPSSGVNTVTGEGLAQALDGTDRLLASGYFRAKMAQEKLIKASPIPYTIVRATQFFEFVGGIAKSATEGQTVRLPPALMPPIAADDVAAVVADVALAKPSNGTFDLAGPEPIRQDGFVREFLNATEDARTVITDPKALHTSGVRCSYVAKYLFRPEEPHVRP